MTTVKNKLKKLSLPKKQAPMRLTEKSFISKHTALENAFYKQTISNLKRNKELAEKFAVENLKLKIGKIYIIKSKSYKNLNGKRFIIQGFNCIKIRENILIQVLGHVENGKKSPIYRTFILKILQTANSIIKLTDLSFMFMYSIDLIKSPNQKKFTS